VLSADALVDKAAAAIASVSSVHVFGTTRADTGAVAHVDVHVSHAAAIGVVRVLGRTIRVRKIGSEFYFQANDAYWKASVPAQRLASFLRKIRGKWIRVRPSDTQFAGILTFGSWDTFTSIASTASSGHYDRRPSNVVRGIDTVSAIDTNDGTIVFVPEDGPALPIEVTSGADRVLDFDAWNKPVHVPMPPPSQVIEAAQLTSGG
jgi:hypothetical protein